MNGRAQALNVRMGVWSKLFGDKSEAGRAVQELTASPALPSPGAPTTIAAVPGRLTVTFYAHDSVEGARGNFLSAVSRGYAKYKQGELVLTLRLSAADDALAKMHEISRFFAAVHAWAAEGRLAVAGGLTQFGERAPFGRSQSGILYADARPIAGVEIPPGALAAILVDAHEVRTATDYGTYRVLTRIGEDYRHFPFPLWSDLDRKTVASDRENETLLAKVARTNAPNVSFLAEDERVRISLSPSVRAGLGRGIASLPFGAAFALLVKPSPQANALLVWHPGQKEPAAISPDARTARLSLGSGACSGLIDGHRLRRRRQSLRRRAELARDGRGSRISSRSGRPNACDAAAPCRLLQFCSGDTRVRTVASARHAE